MFLVFEKILSLEDKKAPFIGNLVIKHMKRCYCAIENTENSNLKGIGYLLMNSDEQATRRIKNILEYLQHLAIWTKAFVRQFKGTQVHKQLGIDTC